MYTDISLCQLTSLAFCKKTNDFKIIQPCQTENRHSFYGFQKVWGTCQLGQFGKSAKSAQTTLGSFVNQDGIRFVF